MNKRCAFGREQRPLSAFRIDPSMPDGYWPICRDHEAESEAYAPPDRTEDQREYFRTYRQENRERIRDLQLDWTNRNRGREQLRLRNYASEHPDRVRAAKLAYKMKRRTQTWKTDITSAWLLELKEAAAQNPICPLCNGFLSFTDYRARSHAHFDHIVPLSADGKHMQKNIRIICAACNLSRPKDGRDLDEWEWSSAW